MRHIYAFRTGFRVQLSHKDVIYSGPLRATQAAAREDLDRVQAYASRGEQVKFLGVLQKEAGNGCARGSFGRLQQGKAPQVAPAMDVGEQQEAPARGEVAEAPAAEHAGEEPDARGAEEKEYVGSRVGKSRGGDVMAMQAAAEPQDSDMAEGGAGEPQEEPAMRVGEQQEAPVVGQEAASEHLGQEPEEAGAPADEAPHLFFVLKRKFFDVMVTGEKKVEYREKKRHWERQMIDEDGQFKKFDYVEFQCAYSHPLRRFRAGFVDVSIVNEHAQRWSNGAVVAFKDTPTYAIRLGPVLGSPYLAPRKEKEAVGPATPKKRGGSVALDSPGTGRKASRKSGREAVSTAKCDQRGSRRGVQVHARL